MILSFGALLSIVSISCGVAVGLLFGFRKYWLGAGLLMLGVVVSAAIGLVEQRNQVEQSGIAETRAMLVQEELEKSKTRVVKLNSDLTALSLRLDGTLEDLSTVSIALEKSKAREERLETAVASLNSALSDSRDRELLLGENVSSLMADNSALSAELANAQSQISSLLVTVEEGNADNAVIREKVEAQSQALEESELLRIRNEYCATTFGRYRRFDGTIEYSSQWTFDRRVVGDGTCWCGRYYARSEIRPRYCE